MYIFVAEVKLMFWRIIYTCSSFEVDKSEIAKKPSPQLGSSRRYILYIEHYSKLESHSYALCIIVLIGLSDITLKCTSKS